VSESEHDEGSAAPAVDPELTAAIEEQLARHRRLASELADIAEFSAAVHDQAATVHDDLEGRLLDPADLRRHAEQDRELAAREREAAGEAVGETPGES
jgi:DNA-binding transcriptional regulator/RsmH inhibitor MraZ